MARKKKNATQKRKIYPVTRGMILACLFGVRFGRLVGETTRFPPVESRVKTWDAYFRLFFEALGGGRTESRFVWSMRNVRMAIEDWYRRGHVIQTKKIRDTAVEASNFTRQQVWDQVRPFASGAKPETASKDGPTDKKAQPRVVNRDGASVPIENVENVEDVAEGSNASTEFYLRINGHRIGVTGSVKLPNGMTVEKSSNGEIAVDFHG